MWLSPTEATPCIIQVGFGEWGQALPNYGDSYCGPTALVMGLYWLSANGFTQLAPVTYQGGDDPQAENLERAIAGLIQTSAFGGSMASSVIPGIQTYLAVRGIDTSQFNLTNTPWPSLQDLADELAPNVSDGDPDTIVLPFFSVGWFKFQKKSDTVLIQDGGHCLTPLTADTDGGTLTLNNPDPNSFEGTVNISQNGQQTVSIEVVPSDWEICGASNTGYSQVVTKILGPGTSSFAILQDSLMWAIGTSALPTSPDYSIKPWSLAGQTNIDTNGGVLEVIAPVTGAGGLHKMGAGTLRLLADVTTTQKHYVSEGILESSCQGATPFGTGGMHLSGDGVAAPANSGGTLRIDAEPGASLTIASGNGAVFHAGSGARLQFANSTSCSIMLGGNTDGTTQNVTRAGRGTLEIETADLNGLGATWTVEVEGSEGNLPAVTNGIVAPFVIGIAPPDLACGPWRGQFLTYGSATNSGYQPATPILSSDIDINDLNSTQGVVAYAVVTDQAIATGGSVQVPALEVSMSALDCGTGVLEISDPAGETVGGLILSGATIQNGTVSFGSMEGVVWIGGDGERVAASLVADGGLTVFGPGILTLTAATSTVQGPTNLNGGTLIVDANATVSATAAVINATAVMEIAGTFETTQITVEEAGTLSLVGGLIDGPVVIDAISSTTPATGGILQGYGTICQQSTVKGLIQSGQEAGTLAFEKTCDLASSATFVWRLNEYVDDNDVSGVAPWNKLVFLEQVAIGSETQGTTFLFDFSTLGGDPDSGSNDSFWASQHTWTIFELSTSPEWWYQAGDYFFGAGQFCLSMSGNNLQILWSPTQPSAELRRQPFQCSTAGTRYRKATFALR